MKQPALTFAAATFALFLPPTLQAQSILLDWDQTWSYMHPTGGALPAGSGATTPHPAGTTPWYAPANQFSASYAGPSFATSGAGFEAGSGPAPIGYGSINYVTTADPAPAEFAGIATTLTIPDSGSRGTAYFRTTFTVPNDGQFYVNPRIRYLLDDGGFIYLDGEIILRVNEVATAVDDYLTTANGTANTESQIRTADLSLPVGSATGANTTAATAIAANATVLKSVPRLSPGVHTLAISVHNAADDSSDLALAVQVQADTTDCLISANVAVSSRDIKGTPTMPEDDTISTTLTVTPEGTTSSSWVVTGPATSSLVGRTGAYNTPVALNNIPISEFVTGSLDLILADSADATCITEARIAPQRFIASNNLLGTSLPLLTMGRLDSPGWVFDDANRTLTMTNPGGNGERYVVTSQVLNTSGQPDLQFSGNLRIIDTSSGNEIDDSFAAYLIFNGNIANPVNLINRYDLIEVDGILSDNELAPAEGTYDLILDSIIPASANSVQLVIEGINNSDSETFIVSGLSISQAPPELQAYAYPTVFDNMGTDSPADDRFMADLVITPVNLGASTGWTSNATPASGSYTTNRVTFGPFEPFTSPVTVTLADVLDPSKTATVVITLDLPAVTITGPANVTRIENGPGFDDDTVTFDLTITGTNGGPGWTTNFAGISPMAGDFGTTTFTIPAPLTRGALTFTIADVSYATVNQDVTVDVPGRFVLGISDLTGTPTGFNTDLAVNPNIRWVNDPAGNTLTLSTANAALSIVQSEVLDLSSVGEAFFSASLQVLDTSAGSNFETGDRFKAELVYTVAGAATTINLIDPYDVGDGSPSTTGTTGGVNGAPDGFINGYSGAAGTDLEDSTVYASVAEDYNAHKERDEFNAVMENADANLNNTFTLGATIPAEADDVYLVITGQGLGGSESVVLSNIRFSTNNTLGDADSDGIPDDYEAANGLNPFNPNDRDLDFDGDGQSNLSEYLAGTAANDRNSFLRFLETNRAPTRFAATWSSVPGKVYLIEYSTNLTDWTAISGDIPAAPAPDEQTVSPFVTIPAPVSEEGYFRVQVKTN